MESDLWGIVRDKYKFVFLIALIVLTGATVGFAQYVEDMSKSVVLKDNGDIVEFVTMENTVDEILEKYNIELGPYDEIEPARDTKLDKHNEITIKRATAARVIVDGETKTVYLTGGTVGDLLREVDVTLGDDDIISHSPDTPISPGLFVTINRIDKEIITEKAPIPFKEVVKDNGKLESGKKRVVQDGEQGELEKKIMVVYRDGKEISRDLIEENVVREPKDRIVENGTMKKVVAKAQSSNRTTVNKNTTSTSSNGTVVAMASRGSGRTGAPMNFRATAYTHTGNRTRTGIWPYVGIIAVDPRVIPLGKQVYIEFPKGWEHLNGYYKAEDTGGAIKGNIVDVFLETESQCRQFGRRQVKVYFK